MRTLAMTILALGLGACAGHITHEEAGVRAHVALAPTQGQLARGELGLRAARPRNSAMSSERGLLLPSFDDALARYLRERELVAKRVDDAHYAS